MAQIGVSNIIKAYVHGNHSIFSMQAEDRRFMMTGVTNYQLERATVGLQLSSWYLQLTTGIADDARIPSSEGNIIERHRALLVVGDVK